MAALGFVRNNPWIKQDRLTRLSSAPEPNLFFDTSPTLATRPLDMGAFRREEDDDVWEEEKGGSEASSTISEIEYGPGIVQRLREKFRRLAEAAAQEAEAADGFRRRSHSVDDLTDSRTPRRTRKAPTPSLPSPGAIQHAYSYSHSSLNTDESKKPMPIQDSIPDPPSADDKLRRRMSSLRRKFEPGARPRPAVRPRKHSAPPMHPCGSESEPEFLTIKQRLRRVPPTLTAAHDLLSPPDPDSGARDGTRLDLGHHQPLDRQSSMGSDLTPPPEEPIPPPEMDQRKLSESTEDSGEFVTSKTFGFYQVHQFIEDGAQADISDTSTLSSASADADRLDLEEPEFHSSPAVDQTAELNKQSEIVEVKVVLKSFDSDGSRAEESLDAVAFVQETQRCSVHKSVGCLIYEEDRSLLEGKWEAGGDSLRNNPPPFLEEIATSIAETITASRKEQHQVSSELLMEESAGVYLAGDGNPIRHSLMSLVSEEDLEEFLQEEEELRFEIEGEVGIIPGGKSLLSVSKKPGKGVVGFREAESPKAYVYLLEESAESWELGREISQEQYKEICQQIHDEYLRRRLETMERERLDTPQMHTDLGKLTSGGLVNFVPSHLSSQEFELGVTNRWSYGASASPTTPSRPPATEDAVSVRPDQSGTSFSQTESASSDLLF